MKINRLKLKPKRNSLEKKDIFVYFLDLNLNNKSFEQGLNVKKQVDKLYFLDERLAKREREK